MFIHTVFTCISILADRNYLTKKLVKKENVIFLKLFLEMLRLKSEKENSQFNKLCTRSF